MPIKKSASKELRKAKKRHLKNIGVISELKTLNKKFTGLVDEKNVGEARLPLDKQGGQAKKILEQLTAKLDKAAAKKIIHKNKASRKKSRLTRQLKKV
jgi:small subunit ribosomal protein S20